MTAHKYTFILLFMTLLSGPATHAEPIASPYEQVKQLRKLTAEIQNNYTQQNQQSVYLGNQQTFMPTFAEKLSANLNEFLGLLRDFEAIKSTNIPDDLQWLAVSDNKLSLNNLVNVGDAETPVNICRATFFGAYLQSQGMYPGQITTGGCRISYGGYAFLVTKFDALTGSNKQLTWKPIADVKKHIAEETRKIKPSQITSVQNMTQGVFFPVNNNSVSTAIYNSNIQGTRPVSGGYEGGAPVLICRAKHNNKHVIGKLVFFDASTNGYPEVKNACDIGVNDKEVVIQNTYELLFWKGASRVPH